MVACLCTRSAKKQRAGNAPVLGVVCDGKEGRVRGETDSRQCTCSWSTLRLKETCDGEKVRAGNAPVAREASDVNERRASGGKREGNACNGKYGSATDRKSRQGTNHYRSGKISGD